MIGMTPRPLLRCTLVIAGLAAAAAGPARAAYVCVDARGQKTIQQTPCRVDEAPAIAAPAKAKLTCSLDAEQLRRATRLENQFLARYPDEAAHRRAQEVDLQPVADRIADARARLRDLAEQRKALDKEAAFHVGKPMPSVLKSRIDANEAQTTAMTDIARSRESQLADNQARYQCQRDTFGKLWKGAAPGSSACDRPACAPP
jgi:hypothetical protein